MGALRGLAATILLLLAAPAAARPADRWAPYVEEASVRFAIPKSWIMRVIEAESGGRTELDGHPIRSRAGAIGLMQLMPGTWAELRAKLGLGPDPDNPRDNILAGTAYLRLMYERFGYPALFAAYNAGPGRYADSLARRRPLPDESAVYLERVAGGGRTIAPMLPAPQVIFAVRHGTQPAERASAAPAVGGLFVPLADRNGGPDLGVPRDTVCSEMDPILSSS